MGKSSSSSKKKRSKNRSQNRARKRGRSESKRYKSTASHRRDGSIYSSDDDYDSRSLVSESSSSSEDDYRSRKSRSLVRKDVKGSKKNRDHRRSSSSESIPETSLVRRRSRSRVRKDLKGSKRKRGRRWSSSSERSQETSVVRRRERSKKKVTFDARKKTQKKKFRREESTSSVSSDCHCESSSSDESAIERRRDKSNRKERNKRKLGWGTIKDENERKSYRSRSCSTCSGFSGSRDNPDVENLTTENNSRRLRSVIIFPKEDKEGREFDKIEHNEEMLYDHDDYPSCKSNDSNDGSSKKDFPHSSSVESEKKNAIDDGKIKEAIVSSIETFDVTKSRKDNKDQYYRSIHSPDRIGTADAMKERNNEALNSVGNASADDLESVLRQRALENLKNFRGGIQKNVNNPRAEKIQSVSLPVAKAEIFHVKSPEDQGAKVNAVMESVAVGSVNVLLRDTVHSSQNEEKSLDRFNAGNESGSAKQDAALVTGRTIEKASGTGSAVTNKPKLAKSALRKISSNVNNSPKRLNVSGNSFDEKMDIESAADKCATETTLAVKIQSGKNDGSFDEKMDIESAANKCATETTLAVKIQSGKNDGDTFSEASGSASVLLSPSLEPVAGNVSANNLQEQAKEGSQLERKTMSVMRGGEMVEVSYNVYIPKKAPGLARRPLKR